MKVAPLLLIASLLAACQAPSVPSSPSGLRPLEGAVTLGNLPVNAASASLMESVKAYVRGQSGQVIVRSELLVDACHDGDRMAISLKFVEVESSFYQMQEHWAEWERKRFAARVGQGWEYDIDLADGTTQVKWTRAGKSRTGLGGGEALFDVLTKQSHFGGMTLGQGQEVLRYRLGDLFAGLPAGQAELAYVLTVSGRAEHDGRPVVVLRASGAAWLDDEPMQVAGIVYVDEATGVALYTDTRLAPMTEDPDRPDVRWVHSLSTAGWPDGAAPPGSDPAGTCAGGRGMQAERYPGRGASAGRV